MTRVRLSLVAILLMAAGVIGLSAQGPVTQGTIIQKIVVKVNGEILTQTEIEQLQIRALRQQNRQVTEKDLATDAGLRTALAAVTPTLLADAVDELLLMQHGRELDIKFTDEQFKDSLERIKQENKIDDKQLLAALQQEGLTLDELRQNFERTYMVQMVERREIMRNMTLTEEETRQYYKAHPEEFMKPPAVTLREILVAVPVETVGGQASVNVAADEAAKEKIAAVRERALKGEDFLALINEVSQSGTKANGGLVGPVLVADLLPALGAMLEKLKPGEITEPIRSRNGYQIYKLETRTAAEPEVFEKVRNDIAQRIYESRLGTERKKFLDKLRVQALIEWKDENYKKLYEQGLAERAKSGTGLQQGPASPAEPAAGHIDDQDRISLARPSCRARADGGDDRHGVPTPRQATRRMRVGGHGDGEFRGPRSRHRPNPRVRGIHRGRAPGVDPDLRRRSRKSWPMRPRSSKAWAPTSSTSTWAARSRRLPNTTPAAA